MGSSGSGLGPQAVAGWLLCMGHQAVGLSESQWWPQLSVHAQLRSFRAHCFLLSVLQPWLLIPVSELEFSSSYDVNLAVPRTSLHVRPRPVVLMWCVSSDLWCHSDDWHQVPGIFCDSVSRACSHSRGARRTARPRPARQRAHQPESADHPQLSRLSRALQPELFALQD